MGHYSDPTAAAALGRVNREFSRYEKLARRLLKSYEHGEITPEQLRRAEAQFGGIYSHVLQNILKEKEEE